MDCSISSYAGVFCSLIGGDDTSNRQFQFRHSNTAATEFIRFSTAVDVSTVTAPINLLRSGCHIAVSSGNSHKCRNELGWSNTGTILNTPKPITKFSIGGKYSFDSALVGSKTTYLAAFFPWALPDAEIDALVQNPWQIFASEPRRIFFGAGGGTTAVDGTASITPSPQTITGSGSVAITGSATVTPAAQTATTAAEVAVSATAGITPAAQTLSATGTVVSGVVGSASITPAAQTLTSGAVVAISATATVTPSAQTLTGSAAVTGGTVAGTATITPAGQTLSATAEVSGGTVTGTANVYVNAQTLLALADIIVDGAATITPAAQTLLGLEAGSLPLEVPESSRILIDRIERLGVSPTVYDPLTNRRVPASRKPPRLG